MNVFLAAGLTAVHEVLSKIFSIPMPNLTSLAKELPKFVTEAETILDGAATGLQKLDYVVEQVLPFVPEPYRTEATGAIKVLVEIEVGIQKLEGVIKTVAPAAPTTETPAEVPAEPAPGAPAAAAETPAN